MTGGLRPLWAVYLKLILTAIFWGGTFVAGRILAGRVPPFAAAFYRFLIATVCLWIAVRWRRRDRHLPHDGRFHIQVALLGLTGVVAYNLFFFTGLERIAAGRASLIIATNPVVVAVLAAWLLGERLRPVQAAGVVFSVIGALVVISRGRLLDLVSGGLGAGEVLIVGCVASWAAFSLLGKPVLRRADPLAVVFRASAVGTVGLGAVAAACGQLAGGLNYGLAGWAAIAYLGVFGTAVGFVWYYEGIERIGAARASLFINFVPVSAVVAAALMLGEPVSVSLAAGAVLVIAGVRMTNSTGPVRAATAKGPVKAGKGGRT